MVVYVMLSLLAGNQSHKDVICHGLEKKQIILGLLIEHQMVRFQVCLGIFLRD
jgi:hypothetical protein